MGEIAEMMLDGTLCEECGVYIAGEGYGVPRPMQRLSSQQERAKSHERGTQRSRTSRRQEAPMPRLRKAATGSGDARPYP